jgi:hypothetical protein
LLSLDLWKRFTSTNFVSAKRISGVSVSVYFWRIFTTCHHLVTQKNPMALFVKQFAKIAKQILRNFFLNHQI